MKSYPFQAQEEVRLIRAATWRPVKAMAWRIFNSTLHTQIYTYTYTFVSPNSPCVPTTTTHPSNTQRVEA